MRELISRPGVIVFGVVAIIAAAAAAWYLASPLFIDRTVDEAFPFVSPDPTALAAMSPEELGELEAEFMAAIPSEEEVNALSEQDREAVEEKVMSVASMMPSHEVKDPMPAEDDPELISTGQFVGADDFHQGSGSVGLYRLADGSHVLRFEEFEVTNGPDLHVLLSAHPKPENRSDVMQGYLDLGKLKGNIGNQNYEIPLGTDLSGFQSVVIYCQPFHVVFASADLSSG